ncbi:oxidoreductase [Leifsonia xyli subsp. xyli str. CTCB07]|uniref:Oxidoreductase n=2 Tax=Leifsonia xyli TaxID=1575 RepID=Q6AC05_LEIXX|nr:oxidoreductase [Leifsonia xyli subsp. xyli str. CTCB07]
MLRAIRAGKHIFTEKVLAPTSEEAERIAAADDAHLALAVSLPRLYDPYTVAIERTLDEGTLGEPTYSRVRLAHDGWVAGWLPERFGDPEAAIGGAFTDLGCHPAYLTRLFHRAEPSAISAVYGSITVRQVEDNAVVTAEFPGGRLGVFEASVVQGPGDFSIELRGTRGALTYGDGRSLRLNTGDGWRELPPPATRPGRSASGCSTSTTGHAPTTTWTTRSRSRASSSPRTRPPAPGARSRSFRRPPDKRPRCLLSPVPHPFLRRAL